MATLTQSLRHVQAHLADVLPEGVANFPGGDQAAMAQ
jgi:hypothetical protein